MITVKEYKEKVDEMTWSYSRLNSIYSCEYCWLQNYILGRRSESVQNAFSQYGLCLHEIQENIQEGDMFKWQAKKKFQDEFEDFMEFPPNKYVDLGKRYYDNAMTFFDSGGLDVLDDVDVVAIEEKALTKVEGYDFTGYIDVIYRDDDGEYVVLDWKSKGKFSSKKEKKKYARQLYLYAIHVKEKYGKYPTRLEFFHFRTMKKTVILFDKEALEEAKKWLVDTVHYIREKEDFEVSDDYFFSNYLCGHRENENHHEGYKIELLDK